MKKIIVLISLMVLCSYMLFAEPPMYVTPSVSGNDIIIEWSDTTNADMYYIYRSTEPYNNFSKIDSSTSTTYTDIGAAGDTKYFYYVTSFYGDDGFEWIAISGGTYTSGPGDTIKTITYNYQIMKYDVTNQQYVDYLNEAYDLGDVWFYDNEIYGYYPGDDRIPAGDYIYYDKGWPTYDFNYGRIDWTGSQFGVKVPDGWDPGDFDDHPVVDVSWYGAWGFAQHYGLDLPTWPEWEKAARGMTGYDYPWGNTYDSTNANYNYSGDPFEQGTTPVGMYSGQIFMGFQTTDSPSPYGLYDIVGNVSQWTESLRWPNNPNQLVIARIVTYCSWGSSSPSGFYFLKQANPQDIDIAVGFRCVKRP